MSVVFLIMLIGCLLGGIIASNKNRSVFGWGFLCFLVPICVILVAILPALPKSTDLRSLDL